MNFVIKILWVVAAMYFLIVAMGDSRNRGYIQGCEDTREFAIEVIREWEASK